MQNSLLLDTSCFLWWVSDPAVLSPAARAAITGEDTLVYVSAVSAWEIVIKRALGKLDAPDDIEGVMAANNFLPLPVTVPHALAVAALPAIHGDPFDRLLVAQARHEDLTLVARDAEIAKYPVKFLAA